MTEDKTVSHALVTVDNLAIEAIPTERIGIVDLGIVQLECFIARDPFGPTPDNPDGILRQVSQRSIVGIFETSQDGHSSGGAKGLPTIRGKHGNLGRYVTRLMARVPTAPALLAAAPRLMVTPDGTTFLSQSDRWLVTFLNTYVEGVVKGLLTPKQIPLGMHAWEVTRSLSGVGLPALIDEKLGFQNQRSPGALQSIYDYFFHATAAAWRRLWEPRIVQALCSVYKVRYDGKHHPRMLAAPIGMLYDMILGSEVMAELRKINPDGPDRHKHHQHFQEMVRNLVTNRLEIVVAFANQAVNKDDFWARIRAHFTGAPLQLLLGGYDKPRITKK